MVCFYICSPVCLLIFHLFINSLQFLGIFSFAVGSVLIKVQKEREVRHDINPKNGKNWILNSFIIFLAINMSINSKSATDVPHSKQYFHMLSMFYCLFKFMQFTWILPSSFYLLSSFYLFTCSLYMLNWFVMEYWQ